jgi:transcriptional regulator with XRE-family HTH domain
MSLVAMQRPGGTPNAPPELRQRLSQLVFDRRRAAGLSQEQVAAAMRLRGLTGITRQAVARWEAERSPHTSRAPSTFAMPTGPSLLALLEVTELHPTAEERVAQLERKVELLTRRLADARRLLAAESEP